MKIFLHFKSFFSTRSRFSGWLFCLVDRSGFGQDQHFHTFLAPDVNIFFVCLFLLSLIAIPIARVDYINLKQQHDVYVISKV